jgi:hypothetical protein
MTRIYTNRRHHRLLWLLGGAALGTAGFCLMALLAYRSADESNLWTGVILAACFALTLIGLEFFARRYVYAIEETEAGLRVAIRSALGLRWKGFATAIGEEIHQTGEGMPSAGYDNRHHRVQVGQSTMILDVTEDREIGKRLRKAIARGPR